MHSDGNNRYYSSGENFLFIISNIQFRKMLRLFCITKVNPFVTAKSFLSLLYFSLNCTDKQHFTCPDFLPVQITVTDYMLCFVVLQSPPSKKRKLEKAQKPLSFTLPEAGVKELQAKASAAGCSSCSSVDSITALLEKTLTELRVSFTTIFPLLSLSLLMIVWSWSLPIHSHNSLHALYIK